MSLIKVKGSSIDGALAAVDGSALTGISSTSFGFWSTTGFKATRHSGNHTFNDATVTTLALSNEDYDNGNNYNTSTYKYVVPSTGQYFFIFNVAMEAGVDNEGKEWNAGIYIGSASDPKLRTNFNIKNSRFRKMNLCNSGTLPLNQNDELIMKVYCDRSDNNQPFWQGGQTPIMTYWEGWRIN